MSAVEGTTLPVAICGTLVCVCVHMALYITVCVSMSLGHRDTCSAALLVETATRKVTVMSLSLGGDHRSLGH